MPSFLSLLFIVLAVTKCHTSNAALRGLTIREDEKTGDSIRPYSYLDIEKSASLFYGCYARILIFDGKDFSMYNIRDKSITIASSPLGGRALRAIPLLVHALKTNFPERFKEGEPPFQMMYTDGDAIDFGRCTSHPEECAGMLNMPPLLAHGSIPKDTKTFPFIKAYPNWVFGDCLYNLKVKEKSGPCHNENSPFMSIDATASSSSSWEDLIPTIVWRGSDHAFLSHVEEYASHNSQRATFPMLNKIKPETSRSETLAELLSHYDTMTPRWKGVMETVVADTETKWIDVRFSGSSNEGYHEVFNEHGVLVHDKKGMDRAELSKYRYQIDFGGGGGTTWTGTINKLAMPGVLFHHETVMKDWYFDLVQPWIHYIPVKWDLSGLHEQYQWAENNPEKCQEISRAATELATYLMSPEYMEKVYNELFRDHVGSVIDAYRPTEIEKKYSGYTIQAHFMNIYGQDGYELTPLSTCDDSQCKTKFEDGTMYEYPYVSPSESS